MSSYQYGKSFKERFSKKQIEKVENMIAYKWQKKTDFNLQKTMVMLYLENKYLKEKVNENIKKIEEILK